MYIKNVCQTGDDHIDFANTFLSVRARVTKANGNDLDADQAVGPANLFLHSLFSQVDISVNGSLITSSTNPYPYRAMLETLLSYGQDAKTSQLTTALYYKDAARHMNSLSFDDNVNQGLSARRRLAARSREIDMVSRLHADTFFQERFMLNEVNMAIKLVRSKDAFCLMGANNDHIKVVITHASLMVRTVNLMSSVFLAHTKALERGTAKYPIRRVVCKSFTIPATYLDINHKKLFSGQLPKLVAMGMIDNTAFNGERTRNPFNFEHCNLTEIGLYLDGQQQHAIKPVETRFDGGRYIRTYNTVFAGTGKLRSDEGLFIDREGYGNGYTLYAFDLTADLGEENHFSLGKK